MTRRPPRWTRGPRVASALPAPHAFASMQPRVACPAARYYRELLMKPEHRDVAGHRLPGWSVAVLLAFWPSGCERSKPRATPTPLPTPAANALIQFPEALRTEDESVNAFIAEAIRVCASEDYDAFRLLWSALEEPIGKQQFQAGFRATRRVTILDLAKRRLPMGSWSTWCIAWWSWIRARCPSPPAISCCCCARSRAIGASPPHRRKKPAPSRPASSGGARRRTRPPTGRRRLVPVAVVRKSRPDGFPLVHRQKAARPDRA
jgi:hypothetical protein